ncbi:MAG TPA: TIR domain-containing protein [Ktedonobacterales bacterium]|nr:TIR domain-containing protein [Ktedonobacterales bacterium]
MADSPPPRNRAFVSYSHADAEHLTRLHVHLAPYTREQKVDVWDDTRIIPGARWKEEIKQAMASAKVAILLVSADFMASEFIAHDELPPLLEAAEQEGALIVPVILSPSSFEWSKLARYQSLNAPSDPLIDMPRGKQEAIWAKLAKYVSDALAPAPSDNALPQEPATTNNSPGITSEPMPAASEGSKTAYEAPLSSPPKIEGLPALVSPIAETRPKPEPSSRAFKPRRKKPAVLPPGTSLTTYKGHSDAVRAVAWPPDGMCIASGGDDKTIQIWEASKGIPLQTYQGHPKGVRAVAWSPDGKQIASVSGGFFGGTRSIQIWDTTSSQSLRTYTGHGLYWNSVFVAAWSPDGTRLASGGEDNMQVWNATTGERIFTCNGHGSWVRTVAWSPNSGLLASGSDDKTVRIWHAATGKHLFTCKGHSGYVRAVAWSPDSKLVASGSNDKTVRIWDAITGKHIFTYEGHSHAVLGVAWSPDGSRIASASWDETVQIWNVTTGAHIYTYGGHTKGVYAIAWSPDGSRIASAGADNTVQVWSAG